MGLFHKLVNMSLNPGPVFVVFVHVPVELLVCLVHVKHVIQFPFGLHLRLDAFVTLNVTLAAEVKLNGVPVKVVPGVPVSVVSEALVPVQALPLVMYLEPEEFLTFLESPDKLVEITREVPKGNLNLVVFVV